MEVHLNVQTVIYAPSSCSPKHFFRGIREGFNESKSLLIRDYYIDGKLVPYVTINLLHHHFTIL